MEIHHMRMPSHKPASLLALVMMLFVIRLAGGAETNIALAVVIVGRWNPVGALGAALLFGLFDSVADKLGILNTGIPSEFVKMTPYLATIVVVCGFVGRSKSPKAAGQPYESQ